MSASTDLERKIRALRFAGLKRLWSAVQQRRTPGWPEGKAFEYLILRAFELEGADVRYPFSVELAGEPVEHIDGALYTENICALVESKDRTSELNVEPIAKLRNQLMRRPAGIIGMIFSQSGFTPPALALARYLFPQTILLWQGREIEDAFLGQRLIEGLKIKYRYAVENSWPDYNLLTGSSSS